MPEIEVLVACMGQNDFSLYYKMNLHTNAILSNQSTFFSYDEKVTTEGKKIKLITTNQKGVGRNRNNGLSFASGDILVFADEDMVYCDDYEAIIKDAFLSNKNADAIIFDLSYKVKFLKKKKKMKNGKRLHLWNAMRFGAPSLAIKRESFEKSRVSFSFLFGGGTNHGPGEDSLFIKDLLSNGNKVYYCSETIAMVNQEDSTWFDGVDDNFFVNKGFFVANCFPNMKFVMSLFYSFKFRKISNEYSFKKIFKLIQKGIINYRTKQ